jgi:8-oxo-dGTP diphosphatase
MTSPGAPQPVVPKRIGIAVVVHDGRVLVGIRGPDVPLPGLAEFPGGKCESDESPEACAVRECREETGLDVEASSIFADYVWTYPHATVHLHFVQCQPRSPEDVRDAHQTFRWVEPTELRRFQFPEANAQVIDRVVAELHNAAADKS